MKTPKPVVLPCCDKTVMVTVRRSKLSERPRNHSCPNCGRPYKVGSDYKPVLR